ncbi:Vacuolar protein sorting-associated protein 9A [Leucoagaricus sp. SymC.cos]|nr:Vacuolar protein sorting-associated protein 9A [Leucoagaricus sp. SymC.cos]
MANRDREKDFPVTSIGRASGARLQTTLQDSHPLGLNTPSSDSSTVTSNGSFTQKYRPYTPRSRVAPSSGAGSSQTAAPPTVTPGTLIHPPSPQHHQPADGGDATTKLQLTSAKSEAQEVGLDTGSDGPSVGWAMLEKIVSEGEMGDVWAELWSAITTGKATLLLPAELVSSSERLTPEFIKDHIAFCDSSSSSATKSTPIVTLSGLRGLIHGNVITFTSTLHPSSSLFQPLQDPSKRPSSLRKLPPLPFTSQLQGFPSFMIATPHTTLPLPPKTQSSKPPLPPRPGARPLSSNLSATSSSRVSSVSSSHSRIPNPFASLFGNRPSTPTPAPAPPALATVSPTTPVRGLESPSQSTQTDPHTVIEVDVMVIQKKIWRKDAGKTMNKIVRCEVKTSLNSDEDVDVPNWVLDRVLEFCERWFPFVRAPKTISSSSLPQAGSEKEKKDRDREDWVVNSMDVENMEDTVEFVQDFYAQLEDYLRVELGGVEGEGKVMIECEVKIRSIMELVEKAVCSSFYDRLFTQPQTDDSSHDTTLSNRIAALNLLDLTLEHLDIAVDNESKPEVDNVVKACGAKLCKLDSARAPKEKARILIDAHQVVVDGLSKLPPIRLMSPEESKALKEQQTALIKQKAAAATSFTNEVVVEEPPLIVSDGSTPSSAAPTATAAGAGIGGGITTIPSAELSPLSLATSSELPSGSVSASSSTSPAPPAPASLPPTGPEPSSTTTTVPSSQPPTPPSEPKVESKLHKPAPVSSDVLLPMLIFSTVKSNPPHLVSNLLYLQRFRHRNAYSSDVGGGNGGEESFCLINMLAVAEFLEGVDLLALGLGSVDDVTATAELTPIISRSPKTPTAPTISITPKQGGTPIPSGIIEGATFRGRVEQQVDVITGSANKVISGVVDSSFGILRSFLPQQQLQGVPHQVFSTGAGEGSTVVDAAGTVVTPATAKPGQGQGFGLLRREAGGFSTLASIAASLPVPGRSSTNKTQGDGEEGQQLVSVSSRPGSVKSLRGVEGSDDDDDDETGEDDSDDDSTDEESRSDEEGEGGEEGVAQKASTSAGSFGGGAGTDTRSIRSFESMMSDVKKRQKEKKLKKLKREASKASRVTRKSLTDRLASVGALAGSSPPDSRRSSALLHPPSTSTTTVPIPLSSDNIHQSVTHIRYGGSPNSSRAASPSLPLSRSPSPLPTRTTSIISSTNPLNDVYVPASGMPITAKLPPPKKRFMECTMDDLTIREVGELLMEYRRLVEGVRELGGFGES